MAIKSLLELGGNTPDVATSDISEELLARAKKDYYEVLACLRGRGVSVDLNLAKKIKADVILHQQVLNV